MLKNLSAERDLYETRMMVSEGDLFEDCAGTEIVEHWNEEQIDEWRSSYLYSMVVFFSDMNK